MDMQRLLPEELKLNALPLAAAKEPELPVSAAPAVLLGGPHWNVPVGPNALRHILPCLRCDTNVMHCKVCMCRNEACKLCQVDPACAGELTLCTRKDWLLLGH